MMRNAVAVAASRVGPPGTVKTNLAMTLGREANRQNDSFQLVTAATLVATLAKAHNDGSSRRPALCRSRPMPPTCSSSSLPTAMKRALS